MVLDLISNSQSIPISALLPITALLGIGFLGFVVFLVLMIAVYIYISIVYVQIAKKTNIKPAGIAWIPVVGPALITSRIAKMHWWPILLLIGVFVPMLSFAALVAFTVFFTIWSWKMFEKLRRPGWWALLCLISPVNLVLLGIVAFSKK